MMFLKCPIINILILDVILVQLVNRLDSFSKIAVRSFIFSFVSISLLASISFLIDWSHSFFLEILILLMNLKRTLLRVYSILNSNILG
jgi:hypothetical protein